MNTQFPTFVRAITVFALLLFFVTIIIGLTWGWATALAFIVGALLLTLCCVITYYCRVPFHFNNLADTNQSAFAALFTNRRIPHYRPRRSVEDETFTPFKFAPPRDPLHEERIVRAILRQVFPDE